jgi:restriction system protein
VGRPDLQAFTGALQGQQAECGVFITTRRFSADARSLIACASGSCSSTVEGFAELMIMHNVGTQDESTFVLKRIDEDFFEQP